MKVIKYDLRNPNRAVWGPIEKVQSDAVLHWYHSLSLTRDQHHHLVLLRKRMAWKHSPFIQCYVQFMPKPSSWNSPISPCETLISIFRIWLTTWPTRSIAERPWTPPNRAGLSRMTTTTPIWRTSTRIRDLDAKLPSLIPTRKRTTRSRDSSALVLESIHSTWRLLKFPVLTEVTMRSLSFFCFLLLSYNNSKELQILSARLCRMKWSWQVIS